MTFTTTTAPGTRSSRWERQLGEMERKVGSAGAVSTSDVDVVRYHQAAVYRRKRDNDLVIPWDL